jgi:hypothetical protein
MFQVPEIMLCAIALEDGTSAVTATQSLLQ